MKAAFVCGTTGEGASLSTEERMAVAEAWVRTSDERFRVIVHAGHTSLPEARQLAAHAREIKAHAVSVLAPYFFKPASPAALTSWCAAVAESAAPLPFYFYHIPSMTGVSLPVVDFLGDAVPRIPNLAGVKFTYEDIEDYQKCVAFGEGSLDILFGRDEMLIEGLQAGAGGAVGSTYNYAAPLYLAIIDAFAQGDASRARELQDKAIHMIALCNGTGVTHLAASKAIMASLGVDCGPVRPPLQPPEAHRIADLHVALAEIGFAQFCCRPVQ